MDLNYHELAILELALGKYPYQSHDMRILRERITEAKKDAGYKQCMGAWTK